MYKHGGDIYRNNVKLDFSVNLNPLGMPKEVEEAAIQGVKESAKYPDYACSELRESLAKKYQVEKEQIICGNGAAELIFTICQVLRPKTALLLAPTFAEYEQALEAVDCKCEYVTLEESENFELNERILVQLDKGYDLMFLCNPNNPTGTTIDAILLDKIVEKIKATNTILVIDECFQEFLESSQQDSRIQQTKTIVQLVILKAFTKIYSMAGLRLGYLITKNPTLLAKCKLAMQPWNVSIPAQYAGVQALKLKGFEEKTEEFVSRERVFLISELTKLGAKVYASKANYIFFRYKKGFFSYCKEKGILIRNCSNYHGLDDHYYRIGLKGHKENCELIQCMKTFQEEHGEEE